MDEITVLLNQFNSPSEWRRIIFWYEPDGERDLTALSDALAAKQVKLWVLTPHNIFFTKYQIELADPDSSYVIYAPFARPAQENNWLLDMELYGQHFEADPLGLLRTRLRLHQVPMAEMVRHQRFFKNQERVRRLERLLPEEPTLSEFRQGLLAVLTNQSTLHAAGILGALLWEDDGLFWRAIEKFYGVDAFWEWLQAGWGIPANIRDISMVREALVANHLRLAVEGLEDIGPQISITKPHASRILMDEWLRDPKYRDAMRPVLWELAHHWKLPEILRNRDVSACDTGPFIDEIVLHQAMTALDQQVDEPERWLSLCANRRVLPWYAEWAREYQAVEGAWRLEAIRRQWTELPPLPAGGDFVRPYAQHLYQVDSAYRQLATAVQQLQHPEWLEAAWRRLDNWYTHHFLPEVARWTSAALTPQWFIEGIKHQPNFFVDFISRHVKKSSERVFVIISDALRYEAGVELKERLERRGDAEHITLTPMQAVLPTYTQLGMAALLPGRSLGITENGGILRDNQPTQGLEARTAVLKSQGAGDFDAMKLEDLMAMPVKEGLERLRGLRLLYLYHDVIDARGDKRVSESYTFEAVEDAVEELTAAVNKLVKSYQAARILITADHGFLFQVHPVPAWDKVDAVSGQVTAANHRFVLGRKLSVPLGTRKWNMAYLGWADWEVVIPEALGRFGGQGGTRFVHGGPMPQEAIVPVIEFRPLRSRRELAGPVDVDVVTQERMITNFTFRVKLFQQQPISPQRPSRVLELGLYLDGNRISNSVMVVCDARGDVPERYYDVTLTLYEHNYLPGTAAELRLLDVTENTAEVYRTEMVEIRIFTE